MAATQQRAQHGKPRGGQGVRFAGCGPKESRSNPTRSLPSPTHGNRNPKEAEGGHPSTRAPLLSFVIAIGALHRARLARDAGNFSASRLLSRDASQTHLGRGGASRPLNRLSCCASCLHAPISTSPWPPHCRACCLRLGTRPHPSPTMRRPKSTTMRMTRPRQVLRSPPRRLPAHSCQHPRLVLLHMASDPPGGHARRPTLAEAAPIPNATLPNIRSTWAAAGRLARATSLPCA